MVRGLTELVVGPTNFYSARRPIQVDYALANLLALGEGGTERQVEAVVAQPCYWALAVARPPPQP